MLQQQCCPLDGEWFGGKKYSILNVEALVITSVFISELVLFMYMPSLLLLSGVPCE